MQLKQQKELQRERVRLERKSLLESDLIAKRELADRRTHARTAAIAAKKAERDAALEEQRQYALAKQVCTAAEQQHAHRPV